MLENKRGYQMSQYKILPSQVLIVPGYTNEEIIAMSAKTNTSSARATSISTANSTNADGRKTA